MPITPSAPVTGTDNTETLQGTTGDDTLIGLGGDDSLVGDAGDDSLVGGDGNDTLLGGDGDDEIEGLYGNDVIDTGAGNDHVFGRDGDDLIYGRGGDDHLIGSMGTDTVYGGAGNDTLAGSQGDDEIHGGAGNDLAFIGTLEGSDSIYMDAGNDIVDGGVAGSSFYAEGGTGNDTMSGGVGDDTLLGGAGDDHLSGGSGNDLLSGGGDNDVVSGGDGDDVFMVHDVPGTLLITDFGANGADDLIDLSAIAGYGTADAVSDVMTFGPYQSTLTLEVTGGTLVVTVQHETPLSAQDLGLSGALEGTDTCEGATEFGGSDESSGDEGPVDTSPDAFVLEGPDAGYFIVDGDTGEIGYIDWFDPKYSEVWDANGDRTYDVSLVERDDDGDEIWRSDLALMVTQTGVSWHDAATGTLIGEETVTAGTDDETLDGTQGDDDLGGDGDGDGDGDSDDDGDGGGDTGGTGSVFTLTGADASIFTVDADTGEVAYQDWFTPDYEEVWDMDRDHIYEVSVIGSDADGAQVSQQDLQLVVSETDAIWQQAGDASLEGVDGESSDQDEVFADPEALMAALSLDGAEDTFDLDEGGNALEVFGASDEDDMWL
jgi:hypothetical protein